MREDAAAVDVDLVGDAHVVAQDRHVLEASPLADSAVPADDGALDPGVVLDLGAGQQDAALQANAVANDDAGADGDVGADAAVLANLSRGVDEDVPAVDAGFARGRQLLGAPLGQGREVETGAGQEILGLADVHPEALEVVAVQQTVADNGGESLLLDRGRSQLNAVEHRGVQNVHSGVDAVTDELDGLLDEAVDARGVIRLVDNDTVLGRLLDLCDDNGTLFAVGLVVIGELAEGVFADDVRVEDEEGAVILGEDLLGQLQGSGGVKGLGLDGKGNVDTKTLLVLATRSV